MGKMLGHKDTCKYQFVCKEIFMSTLVYHVLLYSLLYYIVQRVPSPQESKDKRKTALAMLCPWMWGNIVGMISPERKENLRYKHAQ